jgi:GntR family transcriptional regulator, transcriptional repressor for pyruvate dehydrogenase complex
MTTETADNRLAPRRKLSAHVVEVLRGRMIAGEIPPGKKLPTESRLTEAFGVSRTVVREALAALAADGLVEARQGAGVFAVAKPSAAFSAIGLDIGNKISVALNVLEVRMGLEIEAAGFAAERRSGAQEAGIHEAYLEFDRLLDLDAPTNEADFAIHRAIAQATNNPFYVEVLDALGSRTIPCNNTTPWGTEDEVSREYQIGLQREHAAIIAAISRQDAAAARQSMRQHLWGSQERYRARLRERTGVLGTLGPQPDDNFLHT